MEQVRLGNDEPRIIDNQATVGYGNGIIQTGREPNWRTEIRDQHWLRNIGKDSACYVLQDSGESHAHSNKHKPEFSGRNKYVGIVYERPQHVTHGHGKRVLRYLEGTKSKGLVLRPGQEDQLISYIDSIWGNQFKKGLHNRSVRPIMYGDAILAATTNL